MGAKQRDEMTKLGGDRGGGRGGGGERARRTQGEYESLRRTDASSLLTSLSVWGAQDLNMTSDRGSLTLFHAFMCLSLSLCLHHSLLHEWTIHFKHQTLPSEYIYQTSAVLPRRQDSIYNFICLSTFLPFYPSIWPFNYLSDLEIDHSVCLHMSIYPSIQTEQINKKKYSCEQQLSDFKCFKTFKHLRKKVFRFN